MIYAEQDRFFLPQRFFYFIRNEYEDRNTDPVHEEGACGTGKESDLEIPQFLIEQTACTQKFADDAHNAERERETETRSESVERAVKDGLFACECFRSA